MNVPGKEPFDRRLEGHDDAHDGPVHEPGLEFREVIALDCLERRVRRVDEPGARSGGRGGEYTSSRSSGHGMAHVTTRENSWNISGN